MEPGTWSWILESWAFLPAAALAVMLRRWWVAGRDPDARSVDVRYEPPDGLTPGEVGALRDGRARLRHLTATLLDLDARGHLEIEEVEPPPDGASDRDFLLRPRSDPAEWDALRVHERRALHAIFSAPGGWLREAGGIRRLVLRHCAEPGGRDEARASQLEVVARSLVGGLDLFRRLVRRGHFPARPGRVRLSYLGGAAVLLAVAVVGAGGGPQFLSAGLAAAIVGGLGIAMPHRTEEGARATEEAEGFREFLTRVEAGRLEAMVEGPEEFDRYLAYAVALDVENEWTPALHDVYGGRWRTVEEDEADDVRELAGAMVRRLISGREVDRPDGDGRAGSMDEREQRGRVDDAP